jgi:ribonuclease E
MGQATVDLPDPLDAPPPSSLSGTDDLLAQLAGDEIDRLLAEADLEQKASAAKSSQPPANPDPVQSTTPPASANSTAVATTSTSDSPAPQPAASSAASADAELAASSPSDDELDALLSKIEESAPKVVPPKPAAVTAAPASAEPDSETKSLLDRVPEVLAQFPSQAQAASAEVTAGNSPIDAAAIAASSTVVPADGTDGVMSAAERDALKIVELAEADAPEVDASADVGPGRLAPLIKLLEILNAPLSFVPDALRDTLGKVAIVTLVNSVAVLIYVLLVRH